jgi:hypothetical protein
MGIKQKCLLSLLLNILLEVLASAIRYEREIKSMEIRKERLKLSLLLNDIIKN